MQYKPELNYIYPEKTDQHMLKVTHLADTNFDENYHYYETSKWFRFKRLLLNIGLLTFGYPILTIFHGTKIVGRENIKKNKELLKNGAITICNHVFMWDYICVLKAIRPRMQFHLAWPINFEGPNRKLIKLVGGMPIPSSRRALVKFNHDVNDVLDTKIWFHAFPEASMWYYYTKIRPFKKGIFAYAYKHKRPVIPMAISYRKPTGLYKLFGRKTPLITLTVGTPELPNMEMEKNESVRDLTKRCYHDVQLLAGINESDPDYQEYQDIN